MPARTSSRFTTTVPDRHDLHCNTSTNTHARDHLERLIEYNARGPLSNEYLELTCRGTVKLQLTPPWRDGTSHLLLPRNEMLAETLKKKGVRLRRQVMGRVRPIPANRTNRTETVGLDCCHRGCRNALKCLTNKGLILTTNAETDECTNDSTKF